ncbi:MAG TPA: hypothetical protein VFS23_38015, partial [Vicinamibacterales bacterium]|nr:hypothetical protein [Vicinamibacterales bacterium]
MQRTIGFLQVRPQLLRREAGRWDGLGGPGRRGQDHHQTCKAGSGVLKFHHDISTRTTPMASTVLKPRQIDDPKRIR